MSIVAEDDSAGRVIRPYREDDYSLEYNDYLYGNTVTYFAGAAAVEIATGIEQDFDKDVRYSGDYEQADDTVLEMDARIEVRTELWDRAQAEAAAVLRRDWAMVEMIAKALLRYKTCDSETLKALLVEAE